MKVFVRTKEEPIVQPVEIIQVINSFFARVKQASGRVDTISTRHLSRGPVSSDFGSTTPTVTQIPNTDNTVCPVVELPLDALPPTVVEPLVEHDLPANENKVDATKEEMEQKETPMATSRPKRTCGPPERLQITW
jgi:hypothetical protein